MIRIAKGTANDVVVTLNEKGTASHYLFEFFSHTTNTYHYAVQEDTSAHQERYNQFELTETSGPTATDGEVEMPAGEYRYRIFANTSSSNVDPSGLTELESGMCIVTETASSISSYEPTETISAYEG